MPNAARKRPTDRARKRPSQARSAHTWDAILEATTRILIRRGYAATTTNEVALKAGVSIGTLYEYFPNKDALVRALVEAHLAEAETALAAIDEAFFVAACNVPLADTLERLVGIVVALHAREPQLHRVLFDEAGRLQGVRARATALEQKFVGLTTEFLKRHPEVRVEDVDIAAHIVVSTVDSLVHNWITRPDASVIPARRFEKEIVRLVLSYLVAG